MTPSKHADNKMEALGYEAVAWMWAIHQPRCQRGHDLLGAICDGDHNLVRELMDEAETHEMLGDEFMFSAFMISCALHGDQDCWNQINPHGYNIETQFQDPVFDESGDFLGLYSEPVRAGNWIGAWCSLERVVELADDMNWAIFSLEGDRRPTIGCDWRLSGIHEDHRWVGLWKREYTQMMEKTRRNEVIGSSVGLGIDRVAHMPRALFVMDEWAAVSDKKKEREAAARGRDRLDEMILSWAREAYWPASESDLWNRLWERPPHINNSQIDTEKATRTFIRVAGVLARAARANRQELVEQVDNLGWMIDNGWHVAAAALIEMGAPLQRDGVDIGDKIIKKALLSKGHNVDPTLWARWLDRAKAEGSQSWNRLPEFVREMSVGKIQQRVQKEPSFREMLEMALDTQAKAPAKPAARF